MVLCGQSMINMINNKEIIRTNAWLGQAGQQGNAPTTTETAAALAERQTLVEHHNRVIAPKRIQERQQLEQACTNANQ